MSLFGWCMDNKHSECVKEYRPFYIGTKKVKRKTVEAIIYADELAVCSCDCHKK